ncbi:hypothetical protein PF005_g3775 [Phytophthora fragariae]|uniref:SCP domain-containing protein n=1 Tax=Phytophthora fragariae TaxID=53985 RepID=A0A6A3Z349_9STRA|nr:hypothetical protein PF003_g16708 [Phytophthora fragariae]KAE8946453.1 hypothetical protein PF009_g3930 [Phytophthora fragariae]KAE9017144.1 hypothetical protein PF011_g6826 [Phytophthora fragariae]KAE9121604.1 hypothetical protein PF010_g7040 [Phytophthora fragariae]KAE9132858.1 hypothetical protein PF007_g3568 [Phytophthora fragariae]
MPGYHHQKTVYLLIGLAVALVSNATWAVEPSLPSAIGHPIAQEISSEPSAVNVTTRNLQTYSQTGFQSLLLAAVNKERAARGLSSLCMSSKLQSSAQKHSNDMAAKNYMSHTGSDGSSMSQRITATGFQWTDIAENVAAGQKDVAAVMKSWMNSAGHKQNILSKTYKMFGCGYAYSSKSTYKHYWTQDFGAGSGESCYSSASQSSSAYSPATVAPAATKAPAVTTKTPTVAPSASQSSTMQQQMLNAVNKQRAAAGLSKLCTNSKLQSAAQGHSNDMAAKDYMSHTGSDGSTMSERISDSGYSWTAIAENVAAGQTDVDAVMTAWMNSAGHRANILSSKVTMFGCAYAYNADSTYQHYWTQDFGAGSSESCSS